MHIPQGSNQTTPMLLSNIMPISLFQHCSYSHRGPLRLNLASGDRSFRRLLRQCTPLLVLNLCTRSVYQSNSLSIRSGVYVFTIQRRTFTAPVFHSSIFMTRVYLAHAIASSSNLLPLRRSLLPVGLDSSNSKHYIFTTTQNLDLEMEMRSKLDVLISSSRMRTITTASP